jgi:acetoin:2,6-dichlorophenolindophenol oxidoreductase subunit alpha
LGGSKTLGQELGMPAPEIDLARMLWMYSRMVISRRYEEAILGVYLEDKLPPFNMANGPIPGEMHLSNGQEPCAVGVCTWLTGDDVVTAGHRPHHIAIAKGVNLNRMTAEIFGKKSGLGGGRGGHMHLFDPAVNFACSGIVGEGIAPAVGAAYARRYTKQPGIAVSFMGDGAANQGMFHEALNLAAIWRAPVVFIIEDNAYGISVPKSAVTSVTDNSLRAAAYGMPGVRVTGNDPIAIALAAKIAIDRARADEGPTLIELETTRLAGHFVGDQQQYLRDGELEQFVANDPIPKFKASLLSQYHVDASQIESIEAEAQRMVDEAIAFARSAEDPAPEDSFTKVFV